MDGDSARDCAAVFACAGGRRFRKSARQIAVPALRLLPRHIRYAIAKKRPEFERRVGRPSGSLPGYTYSAAMQKAHLIWDERTLDRWLTCPNLLVPNTAEADRQAVIAYLRDPAH